MLFASFLLSSTALFAAGLQEQIAEGSAEFEVEPLAQGISLAEDTGLAERLDRARNFLSQQRYEEAVPLLQEACETDPAALVRAKTEGLLLGGAATARRILAELPAEAQSYRLRLVGKRAERELEDALMPPDLSALQRVAWRFVGLEVGERASRAIEELLADRGERFPNGEAPTWVSGFDGLGATDPARAPAIRGADDPSLPRLRPADLPSDTSWQFDFEATPSRGAQTSHRMVFGDGLGYLSDGREVVALELGTGRSRWRFQAPAPARPLDPRAIDSMDDATSTHGISMPVLRDGVLLVVIQENIAVGKPDTYSRIDIRRVLPARRLYAFDAQSGEVLWVQDVPWTDPTEDAKVEFAAGPPAAAEGRVYLPVYDAVGTVDLSLLCLDLRTGERLWKRFLISGQLVSNLFGNPLTELATPPPLVEDGKVLVCSHLGGVSAVESGTGAVLWTHLYERMAVRTYESGRVGKRDPSFAASLTACDGKTYVCTPVDGLAGLLLDVQTGTLLQSFPSRGPSGLFLRRLVGMDPDGALVSGTRLAHIAMTGLDDSRFTQPVTVEQSGFTPTGHGSLLIRGEVLVPGRQKVHRFSWPTMRALGEVLQQPRGDYRRSGSLQATHGLLLVMRVGGVDAYASPAALLETLLAEDLTAGQLRAILPLLEQFGFQGDSGFAQQVGDAALRLADQAAFRAQADPLRLLACRSLLAVDDFDRAILVLASLLSSEDTETRHAAAGTLLEVLPPKRPSDPRLAQATALLRRERPAEVPMPDRRREPLAAVLARADLASAVASNSADRLRETLVRTLLLPNPGSVAIDGVPLHVWAGRELRALTARPQQAERLEEEAKLVFASTAAGDAELRAYAPSDAAQRWLRERLDAAPSHGFERIRLLRWCRTYGDRDGAWPELHAALRPTPPPSLPKELAEYARFDLGGNRVLAAMVDRGMPVLFLQSPRQDGLRVLRFDGEWRETARITLMPDPGQSRVPPLADHAFTTPDGLALIFGDRWMHIDFDGQREERLLPSRVHSTPLRVGSMAAVLLTESTDSMRLEVLDLRSGETFLTEDVPRRVSQVQHMICTDRWLFLLQDRSTRVVRIDLQTDAPSAVFSLPFMATDTEMRAVSAFGSGIALVMQQPGRSHTVQIADPEVGYPRVHLPAEVEAKPFRPADGYAWLLKSTHTTSRPDDRPAAVLNWLDPADREQPWTYNFADDRVELPQIPPYWLPRRLQADREVLALTPAGEDDLRIQALRLGEGVIWQADVPGLGFSDLVAVLPQPSRGAGGWALLVARNRSTGEVPMLDLLVFDDGGSLVAHHQTEARTRNSRNRTVSLVEGFAVLRNGEALIFLGESP